MPFPNHAPVAIDAPHAMEGYAMQPAFLIPDLKSAGRFRRKTDSFEGRRHDAPLDAVEIADDEPAATKTRIPADPAEQFVDR